MSPAEAYPPMTALGGAGATRGATLLSAFSRYLGLTISRFTSFGCTISTSKVRSSPIRS
jgi:hypothetical protein